MAEHPIIFGGPMVRAILEGRKTQTRRVFSGKGYAWWQACGAEIDCHGLPVGEDDMGDPCDGPRPYGVPGDTLWVREAWRVWGFREDNPVTFEYQADGARCQENEHCEDTDKYQDWYEKIVTQCTNELQSLHEAGRGGVVHEGEVYHWNGGENPLKWRPSIHMPRWASRIDLKLTGVRVERVQDISEADAKAEGAMFHDGRPIGHHGWRHDYGAVYPTARHSFADLWQTINAARGYSWESNPWVWVLEFERLTKGTQ